MEKYVWMFMKMHINRVTVKPMTDCLKRPAFVLYTVYKQSSTSGSHLTPPDFNTEYFTWTLICLATLIQNNPHFTLTVLKIDHQDMPVDHTEWCIRDSHQQHRADQCIYWHKPGRSSAATDYFCVWFRRLLMWNLKDLKAEMCFTQKLQHASAKRVSNLHGCLCCVKRSMFLLFLNGEERDDSDLV